MKNIKTIIDVVNMQLCTGCGICEYLEPNVFFMDDTYKYGRRPFVHNNAVENGKAFSACPGIELIHDPSLPTNNDINQDLLPGWGPVYSVWEGYSSDSEIRFSGSSGGAATALALFALDKQESEAVLHTASKQNTPYLNETILSNSREDLLNAAGSRYAPSSPCDRLKDIEKFSGTSVFIGKPCDVAALSKARKLSKRLDKRINFTLAFFCAGVPSHEGNINYLRENGVDDLNKLTALKYRGEGWPGHWKATYKDNKNAAISVKKTYAESWGYLQRYRQWRCYICPDHTGEFADIAVGDPWYRKTSPNEPGKSLIIARTKKGLDIILAAEKAGYLVLEKNDANLLPQSQPNLLATRGALWARLLTLRIFGAATPKYIGFSMFNFWLKELSLKEKLKSFIGTAKRIFAKKLNKNIALRKLDESNPQ